MTEVLHIGIPQALPGFDRFFGTWVVRDKQTFLIDLGPAVTADSLLNSLHAAGIDHVDWVLLTHIHIDHAGPLAQVLKRYPEARAVCWAKGLRHVADPSKLWEGSLSVLGELAEAYGRPEGVDPSRLLGHTDANIDGLTIAETPGHAPHHLSYSLYGRLFSGEAGGNLFKPDGQTYLRPATPPRFFLETAVDSVEKLLELPDQPIHYAHYEQAESSHEMLTRFKNQLHRWRDIIAQTAPNGPLTDVESRCRDALLNQDPELQAFPQMTPEIQAREKNFIANSIRGYLGFLNIGDYK